MGQPHRRSAVTDRSNVTILDLGFDVRELVVSTIDEWKRERDRWAPDDGHTAAELAAELGIAPRTFSRRLREGVQSGRYIKGVGLRRNACGASIRVPVYRINKERP